MKGRMGITAETKKIEKVGKMKHPSVQELSVIGQPQPWAMENFNTELSAANAFREPLGYTRGC